MNGPSRPSLPPPPPKKTRPKKEKPKFEVVRHPPPVKFT